MESTAGVFRLLLFAQRFGDRFCQLRLTRFLRQDSCVSLGYHSLSEHDNSSTGMRITQSDELSFFIMPKTKRGNTAMKGKENTDTYRCLNCGWTMPAEEQGKEPDHCPNCLLAIHEEDREGNECGGILEPVGIWVRSENEWEIIQRCRFCGEMRTSAMDRRDNRIKILSIASKPISAPPFPLERIKELTNIMGGSGDTGGHYK